MYKARYYAGRRAIKIARIDFLTVKSELNKYGNMTGVIVSINGEDAEYLDTRYVAGITSKQGFEEFCMKWIKCIYGDDVVINHAFTEKFTQSFIEEVKA